MALIVSYWVAAAPLFALVLAGYAIGRLTPWRADWTGRLTRFVFYVPLPALLFRVMGQRAPTDGTGADLLLAFFGSCLCVFVLGRLLWARAGLDGVAQTVLAMGGTFSNNVLLGLPLVRGTLGPSALPRVALILLFNALLLWTLATVSVQWARHGSLSLAGLLRSLRGVLTNPIVLAILSGALFHGVGLALPPLLASPLAAVGRLAGPLALICLGLSIARYGFGAGLRRGSVVVGMKLVVQPLIAGGLAALLGLSTLDRQVVVLLASLSLGANVYLMAAQFEAEQAAIGSALVFSTALAAITAPLMLALAGAM